VGQPLQHRVACEACDIAQVGLGFDPLHPLRERQSDCHRERCTTCRATRAEAA
jgi:hypothetical protein